MSENDGRQRPDGGEEIDAPKRRRDGGQTDHARGAQEAEQKREFEFLEEFGNFLEEGGILDFLGRGAPAHVDGEHVAEQGLADVQGEAAEEDGEQEDPLEVLDDWETRGISWMHASEML